MYYNQLLGLKNFIEVAEKNRLESLITETPDYFFKILPYAYILGVSDKWIKKFEQFVLPMYSEYYSNHFNRDYFNHFTNTINNVSAPSVQNGGVSRSSSGGGGGCSGGGSGGGGGGSW